MGIHKEIEMIMKLRRLYIYIYNLFYNNVTSITEMVWPKSENIFNSIISPPRIHTPDICKYCWYVWSIREMTRKSKQCFSQHQQSQSTSHSELLYQVFRPCQTVKGQFSAGIESCGERTSHSDLRLY